MIQGLGRGKGKSVAVENCNNPGWQADDVDMLSPGLVMSSNLPVPEPEICPEVFDETSNHISHIEVSNKEGDQGPGDDVVICEPEVEKSTVSVDQNGKNGKGRGRGQSIVSKFFEPVRLCLAELQKLLLLLAQLQEDEEEAESLH